MTDQVPPALAAVLRRWNPAALAGLDRPAPPGVDRAGAETVVVLGAPGSGRGALIAALTAAESGAGPLRYTETPDPSAGVVLMVLDAASPLGREELGLLRGGAGSAHTVVFALTKIDAHDGWAAVARRNADLLAEHAPRFAGAAIHPVAVRRDDESACATGGLGSTVADVADGFGIASVDVADGPGIASVDVADGPGIAQLRSTLLAARAAGPQGESWLRRGAADAAEQTREMVRATAGSLRAGDDTATLRAERAALVADRDGWRADRAAVLRRLTALARVDLVHEVSDQVRAESAAARTAIDRADRAALADYPQQLRDSVAALTARVDAVADARLAEVSAQVLGSALHDENRTSTVPMVEAPTPRHRGIEDRMMIVFGASAGLGLGRMVMVPLSTMPALDLASIPVTLLLGAAAAWWLTRARGHLADRAHLRQWTAETLANVRSALEQRVLGRLVDTEARSAEAVLARHRQRMLESEDRLTALDRQLRERANSRAGKLAACERDLAVLDEHANDHGSVTVEPPAGALRPTI